MTIGGMISQAKRIRTKRGDWMMFATLDDLESSVELVVFGEALSSSGDALQQDAIVLVRGRVDHKDAGSTCVIAQQIERFQPSAEEVQEVVAPRRSESGDDHVGKQDARRPDPPDDLVEHGR